jgi:cytochrome P450
MSEHGPELTFQALTASKYADAVTKEAARVAPSTHLLFREAMEDVAVGDYFIPKGSMVAREWPEG